MGETVTVLRLRIITIFSAPLIHLSDFLLEFSFSLFRLLILSLEFTLSVFASVTVPICLFLLFPLSFLLILCFSPVSVSGPHYLPVFANNADTQFSICEHVLISMHDS